MDAIEQALQYIAKTNMPKTIYFRYCMDTTTWRALWEKGTLEAIAIAFDYGRAKGYRAAKRESHLKQLDLPHEALKLAAKARKHFPGLTDAEIAMKLMMQELNKEAEKT